MKILGKTFKPTKRGGFQHSAPHVGLVCHVTSRRVAGVYDNWRSQMIWGDRHPDFPSAGRASLLLAKSIVLDKSRVRPNLIVENTPELDAELGTLVKPGELIGAPWE